jgi:hypothetical protein
VSSTTITATVPDAGRTIGSGQIDNFPSHTHSVLLTNSGTLANNTGIIPAANGGGGSGGTPSTTAAGTGIETRPVNIALMVCIKY